MNGMDEERTLPMERFSEVTASYTKGKDVVIGQELALSPALTIPARGVYVLELY